MSPATATRELSNALDGEVTLPGDPGYDHARSLYNAKIDKRPEGDPFGGPVAMRLGVGGSWSTVERTRLG